MEFKCLSCGEVNAVSEDKIPLGEESIFWLRFFRIIGFTLVTITAVIAGGIYINGQYLRDAIKDPSVKIEYVPAQDAHGSTYKISR